MSIVICYADKNMNEWITLADLTSITGGLLHQRGVGRVGGRGGKLHADMILQQNM